MYTALISDITSWKIAVQMTQSMRNRVENCPTVWNLVMFAMQKQGQEQFGRGRGGAHQGGVHHQPDWFINSEQQLSPLLAAEQQSGLIAMEFGMRALLITHACHVTYMYYGDLHVQSISDCLRMHQNNSQIIHTRDSSHM